MRIISGQFKGRTLQRPPESITRPTSDRARESIFNILTHLPDFTFEGVTVLDIFAGSGAMGFEALSRGAAKVRLIDKHPEARKVILQNIKSLHCHERVGVVSWDALSLPEAAEAVDLVFIDPPYHKGFEIPVISQLFEKGWVKPGTLIVLESAKKTDIDLSKFPGLVLTTRTFASTKMIIFSCFQLQTPS